MNILIVEDSVILITLYKNIIQTLTNKNEIIKIVSITSCGDYYKYCKDIVFSLALVSWQLKDCNTLSIIEDIINKTSLYIACSNNNAEDVRGVIKKYGVPVKIKPITVEDIREMLQEINIDV